MARSAEGPWEGPATQRAVVVVWLSVGRGCGELEADAPRHWRRSRRAAGRYLLGGLLGDNLLPFLLLALGGAPSPYVGPVTEAMRHAGIEVSVEAVPYEFQRGGNQMLRIR